MEENYGFKIHNTPPPHPLLKNFEEDLFKLVKNIKFRKVKKQFLSELGKFKKEVNNYKDVIVKGDKTQNMYAMDKENYTKLLGENIAKDYRKADEDHTKKINRECEQHAIDLKIENKMEKITKRSAFISIKDHKNNFPNSIQYRLINPAQNNLSKVTQNIIGKAVTSIKKSSSLNLWMGTNEVLEWYEANKQKGVRFIQYDIEAYYPSITEPLLDKAIDFARGFYDITEDEKNMIKTCRQSILYGIDNHP